MASSKKALAKSLAIFTPKRSVLSAHDWFLYRDDASVHAYASVWDFKRQQRCKDDPLTALCARDRPNRLVVSEREIGTRGHLFIPEEHHDKLGSSKLSLKTIHEHC
jgi:hypothetical protein